MNKKCITIVGGAVAGILALTGCQDDTYTYQVSGTVEGRQIDYDCPGEDIAMDAVAFSSGKGRGSGSSDKGTKKSSDKGTKKPSTDTGSSTSKPSSTATPSKAPTAKTSKGVKLSKKPEKPEKVKSGKVPKPLYLSKQKGCETEFELYIRNSDGLFEQDVRQQDYENCTEGETFAVCTED